ncbi:MAG: sulfatase-like hydrolase/transferase [Planctomycetes bacterium]|nr:sulfatase-like hydrolase/transferase [Planctomycetota bacterium]
MLDFRHLVRLVLAWIAIGLLMGRAAAQPDIVVFLSDDHTWRDSSVYGSEEIDTPNMERLARAGMTFDRAFVASPSCAPSRAALLTGLYPARNGAEPNHAKPKASLKKLPAYLQERGYEVVSFGKVGHYGQTASYGFDLARHHGYHEDIAIPKAVEWLRARRSERPLCLFVGTNWPHVPWPTDTSEIDPERVRIPENHVDNATTRAWRTRYLAAVRTMDRELGAVYDAAREALGNDVFFLHTSDHGAQWPFGKWNLYEDGIRTPLIVSWPGGNIPRGVRTEAMVSWIDVLPTLIEVAGGTAPQQLDGRSFLGVLRGERPEHRDAIFTTHSGDGRNNVFPIRSVRTADGWHYVRNLHPEFLYSSHVTRNHGDSGYWDSWVESAVAHENDRTLVRRYRERPAEELYLTTRDPWERRNLVDDPEHVGVLRHLRTRLDTWLESTHDTQSVFSEPTYRARPDAPNVVVVFIDDMGWSDLSSFGGDRVRTQHIDRLAGEGMRFTNFYVNSPICSPSRVALTTGQYPQRWRISSFLNHRANNTERGMAQWLDPSAPVLARALRQRGYATGHFGKWHMGGQRDVDDAPPITRYGFDRSLTNFEGMGPKLLPLTRTPTSPEPGRIWEKAEALGGPFTWMQRSEITQGFVDAAIAFIDQAQAAGQPFYVNVWPDDVHSPFFPPLDRWGEDKSARYDGVLDAMDEQLAPLFDRLRRDERLRANTLVILCSDNGPEPGAGTSAPLRGAKTWLYEGGVRSPLIVWGPGLLAPGMAGTTNGEAVLAAIDLNRSLYAITGTPPPDDHQLDGEDLGDTLLGKSRTGRRGPLFFRRPPDRPGDTHNGDNPDLAVRHEQWKFLINVDHGDPQLYDLDADPSETNNLVNAHADVATRLESLVFAWNDGLPQDAVDPTFVADVGKTKAPQASLASDRFVNPIAEGADPWVVRDPNAPRYLWCFSEGDRGIAIHASERLTSLGPKQVVWRAPEGGPTSRQVWAPELHFLDGRWHIYFAASDGTNERHLTYVLVSRDEEPFGPYTLHGPLETGDQKGEPIWAIDMTVLEHGDARYAIWSGWDEPDSDRQFLYAARMRTPTELVTPRVRLCANDDHPWEFTEGPRKGRGLNEAPEVLKTDRRTFLMYSCGASWLPTYKLGRLELTGDDPLSADAWTKHAQPVFRSTEETYGLGHSCFVRSPDATQLWHVFHAKRDRRPGWRRAVFVQPMDVGPRGFPRLGRPIAPGLPLERPSGERTSRGLELPFHASLRSPSEAGLFTIGGHRQLFAFEEDGLHLGRLPADPVNLYRSGEKALLDRDVRADVAAEVTIRFQDGATSRDAGILFRVTAESIGYDAQRGYFVGLIPRDDRIVFGKMDGERWTERARASIPIDPAQPQTLRVEIRGRRMTAWRNGERVLSTEDDTWTMGRIGLRVVDTHAAFTDLQVWAR